MPASCPASRSARTSDRAITMWPPSTIGGLEVTTAMRDISHVRRATVPRCRVRTCTRATRDVPRADVRRADVTSFHQRRLHADAEIPGILGLRVEEDRRKAVAAG